MRYFDVALFGVTAQNDTLLHTQPISVNAIRVLVNLNNRLLENGITGPKMTDRDTKKDKNKTTNNIKMRVKRKS